MQKFRLLEHGLISSVADVDEFATHFTSEYGNDAEEKILEQLNEMVLSKINSKSCVCQCFIFLISR